MYEQDETMEHPMEVVPEKAEETPALPKAPDFLPSSEGTASECGGNGEHIGDCGVCGIYEKGGREEETRTDQPSDPADPSASSQSSDPTSQAMETASEDSAELESLRRELKLLRARLEERESFLTKIGAECAEFKELYPNLSMEELSDEVWSHVRKGVPIAAATALWERKKLLTEQKALQCNQENLQRSAGAVSNGRSGYLSPDEVRSMTPQEVRANYQSILQSMPKWR